MGREMDDEDLVEELLVTVNSARAFAEFRRTQRKECANLLRWLQLVPNGVCLSCVFSLVQQQCFYQ